MGQRVRMKARYASAVAQRRRRRRTRATGGGNSLGFSLCRRYWKRIALGRLGVSQGRKHRYQNGTARITSTAGLQGAAVVGVLWSVEDLGLIRAAEPTIPANGTQRILMQSGRVKYTLKNQGNFRVKLRIYDFLQRRQGNGTLDTVLNWWTNHTSDTTASGDWQVIGASPLHANEVQSRFKLLKCTTIDLDAGMSQQHTVVSDPKRFFNTTYLEDMIGVGYPYWSIQTLVVVQGDIANGPGGGGTADTVISTLPCKIDCIWEKYYVYCAYEKAVDTRVVANNLSTAGDLQGMGDGDAMTGINNAA